MISPNFDYTAESEPSDESLLEAIAGHDQPALNEFFLRHGGRLKSIISGVVKEAGEADDVLQDIMLQIWREANKYSPNAGKPLSWVSTITRRRAIDRMRRSQTYRRIKERYAESSERMNYYSFKAVTDKLNGNDMRTFLNRQLRNLPALQANVIKLAFFKGMSHREIAKATGARLGTVKTRLELGLRKLSQSIIPLRDRI